MPRLSIDYSKTIIYKICCKDINISEIYVGHTTDLTRRRQRHKTNCNNENNKKYNFNVYKYIRSNGGFENWSVIPIEEFPCDNINEALIRERYWVEQLQASLNKVIPSRTDKEYREDTKEHKKEYDKEYRKNNLDKIKEGRKEWYENNKEIIREKRKEKFTCDCGSLCRIQDKSRHFKSKKHQDYLTQTIPANNPT